ncbi:MAG: DNA methyltransferase [Jatrophihabitans sp.]|uniref:DNA methyltransferase n=1 Tax=Jatrophihabitans sp. TaxID=1932789 RepID=UPI003F813852
MPAPSWQEMRNRATRFASRWRGESRERAEAQSFWNEFFAIFDLDRRRVAVFEQMSARYSTGGRGWMDLFWPGYLVAEHKSLGEDLGAAIEQAIDYLPSIPSEHWPRLIVVCDFHTFRVRNQITGEEISFPLSDLPGRLRVFAPMLDAEVQRYETEEEVNLKATELLAALHDALRESGYEGHALRVLLVRLVFILFADDTQVWEPGRFHDYLLLKTSDDGHDLGPALIHLFQVLNTPKDRRSANLDDDLKSFEYINGGIFAETVPIPDCTRGMRNRLLKACRFDWSKISPAIFGSLFQNVMEDADRRAIGAHYTTEGNILRTIDPLFMDELRAELDAAGTLPALRRFRDKLATLTFFDPACGCGNFLVIAYREIRRLELEVLRRIRAEEARQGARGRVERGKRGARLPGRGQMGFDVSAVESKVSVGQFYGIEVEEFPARIAETAIYLIDHLENLALSAEFGEYYARFPITDTAHIHIGNALRVDWNDVLPATRCTYLLGNPPFVGKQHRTADQRTDMDLVFAGRSGTGVLDYVSAWYQAAAVYMTGTAIRAAFVATNSIVQGEQVPALWPELVEAGLEIDFAHRTFNWKSEASGAAHVHVVIIGFSYGGLRPHKTLFDHPTLDADQAEPLRVRNINPYLVDAPTVIASKRRQPLLPVPRCRFGNMPNDEQHLILDADAREEILQTDPIAAQYIRELIGAEEMLNGLHRYCLWLEDADPRDIRNSQVLRERVARVRAYRRRSTRAQTQALAATPALFGEIRQPAGRYLCLPRHTSMNRSYIPLAFFEKDDIAHDSTLTIEDATEYIFGILSSEMFMTWVRTVAGRLRSDFRLSSDLVYNTFPWPDANARKTTQVAQRAGEVLAARERHAGATLAELYDPATTPADLARAHAALDRTVEGLYGRRAISTELTRQAKLFDRYTELTAA